LVVALDGVAIARPLARLSARREAMRFPSGLRLEAACQENNEADEENQPKAAAADHRSAEIEAAAAEQEKKYDEEKN
jgi:hypothetical protein